MASKNKVSASNWKKIKTEYIKGGISQQKLADKYGVSYSTIHRRVLLEKWSESRKECAKKAAQKLTEKLADSETDRMVRMANAFDDFGTSAMQYIAQTLAALASAGNVTRIVTDSDGTTQTIDLSELVKNIAMLGKSFGLDAESKRETEKLRIANGDSSSQSPSIVYHENGDIEVCE